MIRSWSVNSELSLQVLKDKHNRHCGILTHDPNHIIGMTSFTM